MLKIINRIFKKISRLKKLKLIFLVSSMFLASFAEILSIGTVIPFIATITAPDILNEYPFLELQKLLVNWGFTIDLRYFFSIFFIITVIIAALFRFFVLRFQIILSNKIGADLASKIYENCLKMPFEFHSMNNSSELIVGVTSKTNAIVFSIILPFLSIMNGIIASIMILITLMFVDFKLTIFSFSSIALIYLFISVITKSYLNRFGEIIRKESGRVIKSLQEGFGGIRDVILNNNASYFIENFRSSDLPVRFSNANIQVLEQSPKFFVEAFAICAMVLLTLILDDNKENTSLLLPSIAALVFAAQKLLPLVQQSYSGWSIMKGNIASANDALNLLELDPSAHNVSDGLDKINFNNKIQIIDLSFKYKSSKKEVLPNILNNLNVEINRGDRIGIVGSTGSGKSTFLDIFMGLLEPSSGSIIVDNTKLNKSNIKSWYKKISHVPQNIFLSDVSVMENIAIGKNLDDIDLNKVVQAAKKANIHSVIKELEDKYLTNIGERGIRFSGGQRQRLAIARALYDESEIIVLDEATSALDDGTESNIMKSINELSDEVTIIIVAHRTSTLASCNKIILIEDGNISYTGSYEDYLLFKNN
jgi:ABC-type multidrug transport system fused ATPase/permease subunit